MSWIVGILSFFLVVACLLLMLLVLIQLPKKEAGMGQAFGGGATDALFGAGSGTALTKLTKYAAGIFFGLTLFISVLHLHAARSNSGDLRSTLTAEDKLSLITPVSPAKTNAAMTNSLLIATNVMATNLPAKPSTNATGEKPK